MTGHEALSDEEPCGACGCTLSRRCDEGCHGEPHDDGNGPRCARCYTDLLAMIGTEDGDEARRLRGERP